jgi:hypothetical protein
MTRTGRKPQGAALVDRLYGSDHAKARLKLFLQTLNGELTVDQACEKLDIWSSRFFDQRNAWLHEALALLEPRPVGRPRHEPPTASPEEVAALRQRVQELEARAAAVEAQAELVRTLPHVVARAAAPKKTPPHAVQRRQPARGPSSLKPSEPQPLSQQPLPPSPPQNASHPRRPR